MPELEPEYRQIGDTLRRLRRQHELSQESLASACQMSRSALANIEAGQQRVAVHQLLKFARILRVDAAELLPSDAVSEQPLDEELIGKGVPQQAASAVARVMDEFKGERIGASTSKSRTGGTTPPRRKRHHQATRPR